MFRAIKNNKIKIFNIIKYYKTNKCKIILKNLFNHKNYIQNYKIKQGILIRDYKKLKDKYLHTKLHFFIFLVFKHYNKVFYFLQFNLSSKNQKIFMPSGSASIK
jgi:hypothetical protein